MNNRITRTNDMHLLILEARLLDAVDVLRKASCVADYVAAVGEIERARKAYQKRRAMFRPRRVRKAEQRAKAEGKRQGGAAQYMAAACYCINAQTRGSWFYNNREFHKWRRYYVEAARRFRKLATSAGRKLP